MHTTETLNRAGKSCVVSALGLALALGMGSAQAGPITQWSYSTNSMFSDPVWETGGSGNYNSNNPGQTVVSDYELSWGRKNADFTINDSAAQKNRSALTIGNAATNTTTGGGPVIGSIITAIGGNPSALQGEIEKGISITHWNNTIKREYWALIGATITDTLTLTPTAPAEYVGMPLVDAPTLVFDFQFRETRNEGNNNGRCADGSKASTYAGGCPDLFGFENSLTLNKSFQYADSGVDGIFGTGDDGMRTYFASLFILDNSDNPFPLSTLTSGECGALGLSNGCFGFRTMEDAQTTARFAFAVTTDPLVIPEPGTLALLGVALAAVGLTARRKSHKPA